MAFLGGYLGPFFGAYLGATAPIEPTVPPPAFEDYVAELAIDDAPTLLELADHAATLEIDMSFVIKAGDRLPSISGRITVPAEIDLTGAPLYMTLVGRDTGTALTVAVENDGLDEDSPAIDNEDGTPTIWRWHHDWDAGETDVADKYKVGISTEVGGLQATFPNSGWGTIWIQSQLAEDPVP